MTDKVVSLTGKAVRPPGEPDPDVLKEALRILKMAESGEINGIAGVFSHSDGTHTYADAGLTNAYATIGALEVLKARIMEEE